MLMDIVNTCNSASLAGILTVVKRVLSIIQIVVPILLMVMMIVDISKLVMDPDAKNGTKKVFNKIIAAAIIFFIPMFVNLTMGLIGENTNISSCWINAGNSIEQGDGNYSGDDNEKTKVIKDGSYKPSTDDGSTGKSASKPSTVANGKFVFVGDSRTVQMYAYKSGNWTSANYSQGGVHIVGNDVFIAQGSQGLNWMKSTGMPAANSYLSSGVTLVIWMGVNDLSYVDQYITYLQQNSGTWSSKGIRVYYVSVGPCQDSYNNLNSSITNFNSKLKNNLPSGIKWIDLSTNISFKTTDGLHYDQSTSNAIYNYIKSQV